MVFSPDIDHYNSPYKATVSQLIWEQVIKFGMDYSLLRVATVNKIANAACEPALKCLKLYQKLKVDKTQSAIDQPTYLQIRHFTFRGYFPSVNRHDITLSSFYYQDFFQKCPTAAGCCAFFLSRNSPGALASGAATEGVLWLFAVVLIRFCSCLPFFTENKLIYWEIGRPIGNIAGCCEFF